jgi:hypothetical protein
VRQTFPGLRGFIGGTMGGDLGETEVENLGVSALGDEKVGRLDVAMNDALAMGGVERIGNLDRKRQQGFQIEGTAGDAVLQSGAVEKLHHDERLAVLLTDLVNGADVGMVECGSGPGLAAETFQGLRIVGDVVRKELESDEASELGVFGLVNQAHAAAAQLLQDAVVGNSLADHPPQILRWRSEQVNESRASSHRA